MIVVSQKVVIEWDRTTRGSCPISGRVISSVIPCDDEYTRMDDKVTMDDSDSLGDGSPGALMSSREKERERRRAAEKRREAYR